MPYNLLRGIGPITAATLIAEIGDITRFKKASQLMAYVRLVPREYSSGNNRWQRKNHKGWKFTYTICYRRIELALSSYSKSR